MKWSEKAKSIGLKYKVSIEFEKFSAITSLFCLSSVRKSSSNTFPEFIDSVRTTSTSFICFTSSFIQDDNSSIKLFFSLISDFPNLLNSYRNAERTLKKISKPSIKYFFIIYLIVFIAEIFKSPFLISKVYNPYLLGGILS